MSKTTITRLIDDLDGSEADYTFTFAVNGTEYAIDLNEQHADEFFAAFQPYLDVARRETKPRRKSGRRQQPSKHAGVEFDARQVRQWAEDNGIPITSRGRIPYAVVDKYLADQGA